MNKKIIATAMSVFMIFGIAGCSADKDTAKDDNKVKITVSINPVREFAQAVGGDKVDISMLVPEGTEPHDFEPKAKGLDELTKSDIFVYTGAGMEGWIDKVLEVAESNDKLTVVDTSKNVNLIKENGKTDPHTWLSLKEAKNQSKAILDALVKVDEKNKSYYEANYDKFSKELDTLYNDNEERFKNLKNKNFVTGHEAFGYLCRDFSLQQKSVEDMFGEGEATPKTLESLASYCKGNNIKTIFSESLASPKTSETLANEAGAKVQKIYTLESKEDNLDYLQAMKKNLDEIYESLK